MGVGGLRDRRWLVRQLILHLEVLLLLLHLRLWLLRLHLLLRRLMLNHGLRAHHLHERILVVGHHAVSKLGLLLSHESLKLLLVESSGQTELRHHGVTLLHLGLLPRWRLGLRLRLLLLWHLHGLLHLTLLPEHIELLWSEVVKIEEGAIVRLVEARHGCDRQQRLSRAGALSAVGRLRTGARRNDAGDAAEAYSARSWRNS